MKANIYLNVQKTTFVSASVSNEKINTLVKPKYHLKLNYITVKIYTKDFNYSSVTYSLIFNQKKNHNSTVTNLDKKVVDIIDKR